VIILITTFIFFKYKL